MYAASTACAVGRESLLSYNSVPIKVFLFVCFCVKTSRCTETNTSHVDVREIYVVVMGGGGGYIKHIKTVYFWSHFYDFLDLKKLLQYE